MYPPLYNPLKEKKTMIARNAISRTQETPTQETPIVPLAGKKKPVEFKGSENLIIGIKLGEKGQYLDPLQQDAFTSTEDSVGTFQSYIKDEQEVTYNFADNDKSNTVTLGASRYSEKPTTTNIKLGKGDSLNISGRHEVSGITTNNDDGTVTLTLLETNETNGGKDITHTTNVTLPQDELEAITAGLSGKQKDAIQKFQNQIETEGVDPPGGGDEDEPQPNKPDEIIIASAGGTGRRW